MVYEFDSRLYSTEHHWLDAIIESWISSMGKKSPDRISDLLFTYSNDDLAKILTENWFVRNSKVPTMESLTAAFARVRNRY